MHIPNYVHEVTSASVAVKAAPRIRNFVEAVSDIKAASEYAARVSNARRVTGMNDSGNFMWAACVPGSVMAALIAVDPAFGTDPKLFCAWLRQHPEYAVATYKALG